MEQNIGTVGVNAVDEQQSTESGEREGDYRGAMKDCSHGFLADTGGLGGSSGKTKTANFTSRRGIEINKTFALAMNAKSSAHLRHTFAWHRCCRQRPCHPNSRSPLQPQTGTRCIKTNRNRRRAEKRKLFDRTNDYRHTRIPAQQSLATTVHLCRLEWHRHRSQGQRDSSLLALLHK